MGFMLVAWAAILFFVLALIVGLGGATCLTLTVTLMRVSRAGLLVSIAIGLAGAGLMLLVGFLMRGNAIGSLLWVPEGMLGWWVLGFFPPCCLCLLTHALWLRNRGESRPASVS